MSAFYFFIEKNDKKHTRGNLEQNKAQQDIRYIFVIKLRLTF